MRRTALILLSAVLTAILAYGCAEQQGFQKTANTGERADTHPYMSDIQGGRMESAGL